MLKIIEKVIYMFIIVTIVFSYSTQIFAATSVLDKIEPYGQGSMILDWANGIVRYRVPADNWGSSWEEAFFEVLAYKDDKGKYRLKEYDTDNVEKVTKEIHDVYFREYKKNIEKLEKEAEKKNEKFDLQAHLETTYDSAKNMASRTTGSSTVQWNNGDQAIMRANDTWIKTLEKLISGEYDIDMDPSDTEDITSEELKETQKEALNDYMDDLSGKDDETVGILPERKLGLITDQKEETVKETAPDTIIESADEFLNVGQEDEIDEASLQNVSNTVYNILLAVAIVLAVIMGLILGIKFMASGIEGQAKVKEALIPHIAGCTVAFSAFGIWKLIITILNGI